MNPELILEGLRKKRQADQEASQAQVPQLSADQLKPLIEAQAKATKTLLNYLSSYHPKVSVDNLPRPSTQDNSEVVTAIEGLGKQQTQLLNALKKLELSPEINVPAPVVKVDAPDLSKLEKAIKASKPEPVTIDLSDLSDALKANLSATKEITKTLNTLKFPVPNVPTDPLIYYLPGDIDDSGAVQYFGYTDNKGAWYIRKYDTSASPKTIRFAFGQTAYSTNWTNRASLAYAVWGS